MKFSFPTPIGKTIEGETIEVDGIILKVQACSSCDKDCFSCLNGLKVGKFIIKDGEKIPKWKFLIKKHKT